MKCIVTAGPTFEPLDQVRRLTNFSTGRLGTELAQYLVERGHEVTILLGQMATHRPELKGMTVQNFTTTEHLRERLHDLGGPSVKAVFHAAAVSDFGFGKVFAKTPDGALHEVRAGKFSSRAGSLMVELKPTKKILSELRDFFSAAWLVGWKYEVDGDRQSALKKAREQTTDSRTDVCIANGPAYGRGFGVVTPSGEPLHLESAVKLYSVLEQRLAAL